MSGGDRPADDGLTSLQSESAGNPLWNLEAKADVVRRALDAPSGPARLRAKIEKAGT